MQGLYTMSGSRGSCRSRGSRGRVPLQGDRSGMRQGTSYLPWGYTGHPPSGAGSTSRGGMGNPMGDMQGVLREHAYHQDMQALVDHEDDDYEPELGDIDGSEDGNDDDIDYHDMHDSISIDDASHASQRPFISRIGEGFASSEIHRSIGRVLREHLSGPWTTYRKVPQKVVIAMFKRFKIWNTEDWCKKSTIAKDNRSKTDRGGKTSRHTGGSIGYNERRLRLRVKLGKEPTFLELFLDTHLNKKYKKRLWIGELNVKILEGLQFCTERAKNAYFSVISIDGSKTLDRALYDLDSRLREIDLAHPIEYEYLGTIFEFIFELFDDLVFVIDP
ncbi:hypothetical protein R6Q57_017083 [Mikania cordata]